MPYYRIETYTTTGTMPSWNMDNSIASFSATVAVTPTNGSSVVNLQYSLNPLNNPTDTDSSAIWLNSSLNTAITTSTVVTFVAPISRIRLVIGTSNATGVIMEMNQGLSAN